MTNVRRRLLPMLFIQIGLVGIAKAEATIEQYKAKIVDSVSQESLFQFEREAIRENLKTSVHTIYKDTKGVPAIERQIEYMDNKLQSLHLFQRQLQEEALIEVKQGQVHFWYKTADGKEKRDSEALEENTIIDDQIVPFIAKNEHLLAQDQKLKIRLLVPDRLETVGFTLQKSKNEGEALVVKMSATSPIISLLVKPLFFYFDTKQKRLIKFEGRVLPKKKEGTKWSDLDALFVTESQIMTQKQPEQKSKIN